MAFETANYRGLYAAGTTYAAYDTVDYEGDRYQCVLACTGVDPAGDNGTHWAVVAAEAGYPDGSGKYVGLDEATYQAVNGDTIVGTANSTISLPAPTPGATVDVWSNGASITLTVQAVAGATVNGGASVTVTTQYTKKKFIADGTNWLAA